MNIFEVMNMFQQNPLSMLQKRFQIPNGMNNPDEIIQHLVNSGQVSQNTLNQIMQMKNNPMFRRFMK